MTPPGEVAHRNDRSRPGGTASPAAGFSPRVTIGYADVSVTGREPFQRALHLGLGGVAAGPVGGLDVLARLQVLVVHEEVLDGVQLERRDVGDLGDVIPARVTGRHAQ